MKKSDLANRWHDIVRRLEAEDGRSEELRDTLEQFQAELQEELFGSPRSLYDRLSELDARDPRLEILLDALAALSVLEDGDPSYPWERGGLLAALERHLEAADDYLRAARLLDADLSGAAGLGDEADWARAARYHAAKNFALGGQPAAAASLLPQLEAGDRAELEPLISGRASRTIL